MKNLQTRGQYYLTTSVIAKLQAKNVTVIIYEQVLDEESFEGLQVLKVLEHFKSRAAVIVANRMEDVLKDVKTKVYTRDIFNSDI